MRLHFIVAACAALLTLPAAASPLYWNNFEGQDKALQGAGQRGDSLGYKALGFENQLWRNDAAGGGVATASTLRFTLDAARSVQLDFDLAIIGSWEESDRFNVAVDQRSLFWHGFASELDDDDPTLQLLTSNQGPAPGKGKDNKDRQEPDPAAYGVSLLLGTLGAGEHVLSFYASGPDWKGGRDESFGLDNVRITGLSDRPTNPPVGNDVPEPQTLGLVAAALLALARVRRRR